MPPSVSHVLETCLYVKSMSESVEFYKNLLGLKPMMSTPRISGFALGNTTLLLFQLGLTAEDSHPTPADTIPGHGPSEDVLAHFSPSSSSVNSSTLKQHYCLAVSSRAEVAEWEKHLHATGIKTLGTMNWEKGGRSVYFADPDGHVGEFGSRGIWDHY